MTSSTDRCLAVPHDHVVQFYGGDDELAAGVGRYLAEGLDAAAVAIVMATRAHRRAFTAVLTEAGYDVGAARADGRLLMLDAAEAMAALLVDGRLPPHRFDKVIGDPVRRAAADGRAVRAFGEIVALLWGEGHVRAALDLEALWNGLGLEVDLSLYCAYPSAAVEGEGDVDAFHGVCRLHSAIVGAPLTLPRFDDNGIELARTYRPGRRGPAEARRFVTETLAAWGYPELVDDAAVVATELATNAVLHARTEYTVTIARLPGGTIRVAVRDANPLPPRPRRAEPYDGSGRGLGLVDAIAAGWGADLLPDGKVVWARLGC